MIYEDIYIDSPIKNRYHLRKIYILDELNTWFVTLFRYIRYIDAPFQTTFGCISRVSAFPWRLSLNKIHHYLWGVGAWQWTCGYRGWLEKGGENMGVLGIWILGEMRGLPSWKWIHIPSNPALLNFWRWCSFSSGGIILVSWRVFWEGSSILLLICGCGFCCFQTCQNKIQPSRATNPV